MNNRKSEELYRKAINFLPGGVSRNTVFRKPFPDYALKASGCYITDVDGVERIDFSNNMASLIHGHSHPAVVEGVIEQLKKGTAYTLASEAELRFAELLINRVESFEKIRFVNSGTEAVMIMIKAARAYTGKPKIAKAEGAYHGTYDFAEISQHANPSNWGDIESPNSVPLVYGTPEGVLKDVIIFPFNDIERTIRILNRYKNEIACVLLDPVPHRVGLMRAKSEYVEAIYKWTRENNALLIFDEVLCFRVNYGGAQEIYNHKPDLTALGKIIGGGFPVGAIAGREEVLKVMDPRESKLLFPHSGTFSANPITMTAGYIAMSLFDKEAVEKLNALTHKAKEQINEVIKICDVPVSISGAGSMFRIHLRPNPPTTYRETYQNPEMIKVIGKLLNHLYYEEKILMINTFSCMFSTAITQREVDRLCDGLQNAFKLYKKEIESIQSKN